MLIRLRRPWRARLVVALTALVLAAAGVALILRGEAPSSYPPLPHPSWAPRSNHFVYVITMDRDAPPAPATLCGAVLLSVAGALCLTGCLIIRRRQRPTGPTGQQPIG
ncbi:hypothetical protein GCM10012285_47360 [Streptomyces kronopolitis]|uniref:Uncharacterized protein n=1 Tax=Streptomyces kronopolitis TaxID=1612435 RepID=A0ABQ2JTR8_9ACTN|nr:hypothetical protein [Streptomyces kronopolitis]GGN54495.1 hypothetical protein GCM10012285_47360 [Streptomyces kronopolitis]